MNRYLDLTEGKNYNDQDVEILFNRNMKVNEAEIINNCVVSKTLISEKTILAHHPYVTDVEEELQELEKQEEKQANDEIPIQPLPIDEDAHEQADE